MTQEDKPWQTRWDENGWKSNTGLSQNYTPKEYSQEEFDAILKEAAPKHEDRNLLLKDLCTRLPYNVVIRCTDNDTDYKCFLTTDILNELLHNIEYYDYKPYLRPMSSMTEEEEREVRILWNEDFVGDNNWYHCYPKTTDFYLSHHLDFRNLIPKGLAIEAPKDMYKTE